MTQWSKRIPFKVDIAGIIEIMGASLYSRADTPIRELIQNAHDSILRRRQIDLSFTGRITIQQDPEACTLSFTDDGIGLTADEAERFLGTLGVGITGMIRRGRLDVPESARADGGSLIGQFGVGLFSAFMLADRIIVESRKADGSSGVRWEAGVGTEVELSSSEREAVGTTVTLVLKPAFAEYARNTELVEQAVREFADFIPIPIFINNAKQRANVINVAWFDPTPDPEGLELALEEYFNETPLDVISLRSERPVAIAGAFYVTPRRTPGFATDTTITVTVRRMVISRHVRGLLPDWCLFLRGVLELNDCSPTASREDLVRNENFEEVREFIEQKLFEHFEMLAVQNPQKWQSVIAWHRYALSGAAIVEARLRNLLAQTYRFNTSQGPLSFIEIIERSKADPLFETEADFVIWYNSDRRQERWANGLFAGQQAPCVHTFQGFEETLLTAMAADAGVAGADIEVRVASPSAKNFAETILGVREVEAIDPKWTEFFSALDATVMTASFQSNQPVMAFLNERRELRRTFDELKKEGNIPPGFQRLIDQQLANDPVEGNEVLLNRDHRLVGRALQQSTSHPLASVLRLLVISALNSAGASVNTEAYQQQASDLDWIAETLWGRN